MRLFFLTALLFPVVAFAGTDPLASRQPELSQVVTHPIDMTRVLMSDGKPIPDSIFMSKDDPDCVHCPVLTLGHAAEHALFAGYPDERDLPGEQKWSRGVLGERIKDDRAATPTVDEISLIKKLMGKLYGVAVVKEAYPLLDPNAAPPTLK